MNREQMIAWLTLEGWEPNGENTYWWYGCTRDGLDVFYNTVRGRIEEIRIDSPKDRPACAWECLPTDIVAKLCRYIQEKDHEPR